MSLKKSDLAINLNMKSFKELCKLFSPDIAVMIRGEHGIGKTEGVRQVAALLRDDFYKDAENCRRMVEAMGHEKGIRETLQKTNGVWTYEMGIPVIERRLSQLMEGDIVGLPFNDETRKGTQFKPVDWLINAADFPVLLFMDELNRAPKQVEQATFQLADSKAFYGRELHRGTRIYVAINIGDEYQVESFDRAAISRYAVIDFKPTVEEWLSYLKEVCNPLLPMFLNVNKNAIESSDVVDPDQKTADRRAWRRLDRELTLSGLYDDPRNPVFLYMTASMIGPHFANLFWDFVKENDAITAKDILLEWKKKLSNSIDHLQPDEKQKKLLVWANRVKDFFKENTFTKEDAEYFGPYLKSYLDDQQAELVNLIYQGVCFNSSNTSKLAEYCKDAIIRAHNGGRHETKVDTSQRLNPILRKKNIIT